MFVLQRFFSSEELAIMLGKTAFKILHVTMVGHPMVWMTFYLVTEFTNHYIAMILDVCKYEELEAPIGSKLCAFDTPSDTLSLNSVLECALQCQRFSYCENFNYNRVSQKCDVFFNRPKCYGPLSSCTHYQVYYSKIDYR